jgi:hypothetical protein
MIESFLLPANPEHKKKNSEVAPIVFMFRLEALVSQARMRKANKTK